MPLASQPEKDVANWPPRLESTLAGTSGDLASSFYSEPDNADTKTSETDSLVNLKSKLIVNWIYQKQQESIWTTGLQGEGVVLRKGKGRYMCCPTELQYDGSNFYQMVAKLNVCVCLLLFLAQDYILTHIGCDDGHHGGYRAHSRKT